MVKDTAAAKTTLLTETVLPDKTFATTSPATPEIKVYPNPAADRITVSFGTTLERATAVIADIKGVTLQTPVQQVFKTNKVEIDVTALRPGIYLIQIQTATRRQFLKFVKL